MEEFSYIIDVILFICVLPGAVQKLSGQLGGRSGCKMSTPCPQGGGRGCIQWTNELLSRKLEHTNNNHESSPLINYS